VIRRRRSVIATRSAWAPTLAARAINSQPAMALITPRARRILDLLGLRAGRRYLDVGCGTASYAHLLAATAHTGEAPVTIDPCAGPGPVDLRGWPGDLPFRDASFDAITCLYFVRRLDDDGVRALGTEVARVLAPGGSTLVLEIAPVRNEALNRMHARLVAPGCAAVDLRGWGRLAALFTGCGFDALDLVNAGPFLVPPIPRVGVLLRKA
jgi:SAM-dependent methyltransferase